jgi:hypothetical protein
MDADMSADLTEENLHNLVHARPDIALVQPRSRVATGPVRKTAPCGLLACHVGTYQKLATIRLPPPQKTLHRQPFRFIWFIFIGGVIHSQGI